MGVLRVESGGRRRSEQRGRRRSRSERSRVWAPQSMVSRCPCVLSCAESRFSFPLVDPALFAFLRHERVYEGFDGPTIAPSRDYRDLGRRRG